MMMIQPIVGYSKIFRDPSGYSTNYYIPAARPLASFEVTMLQQKY
jgi:hypothetical protein